MMREGQSRVSLRPQAHKFLIGFKLSMGRFFHFLFLLLIFPLRWIFFSFPFLASFEHVYSKIRFNLSQFLDWFVHFLASELGKRIFSWIDSAFQNFDIFLLVSDQWSIGGVSQTDVEFEGVIDEVAWVELGDGDELVVAPALADIEGGGVLSHYWFFGIEVVQEFYFVVVLIVVLESFGKLEEHW